MTITHADTLARNKRGDWSPPEVPRFAPIYVWPVQPLAVIKWVVGYPGYLLPWNVAYATVSVITWLYLTPDMATMKTFDLGWVAFIFARNLGLVVLIVGAWHIRLYVQKAQGTNFKYSDRWLARKSSAFLFGNQVLDNIFWTVVSAIPIWTAYEVLTLWAFANGFISYVDLRMHPVYWALLTFAIPLLSNFHFYLIHRLIHWPPLYRTVHYLHHKNVNPGPWSGLSMHPVEHLLYFSCVLIHWIIPSHPLHAILHLQINALTPAQGHAGFDRVAIKHNFAIETGSYFHYLHHRFFECNYGSGMVPFDKWFGTFHNGTPEAEQAMNKRFLSRRKAALDE